ncbi:hypothetical protein K1T71_008911 [Dendrolimus kikuchii]|uniref:Uncharacterized protein n=1 Tax=Dendrolimus kikuchii TaxID=765133 RepID=A0ACC1CWU9_9NEOP|nr:hypothetical protein K1T71_008911 [Dendrolimus kikuchii]
MAGKDETSDSDGPIIDDNVIRIQLRKPSQSKWELRTRNLSPGIRFPTIQLFDCEGNLLVETNDENISIKSSDFDEGSLRATKSLREKDFRHIIDKRSIKKHNTISGDKVYTRVYRTPLIVNENKNCPSSYVIKDSSSVTNIPSKLIINHNFSNLQTNSLDTTPFQSDGPSVKSSYKSSDNESCEDADEQYKSNIKNNENILEYDFHFPSSFNISSISSLSENNQSTDVNQSNKENGPSPGLHKSQSLNDVALKRFMHNPEEGLLRSKSGVVYELPRNKVSFLNTYLKSLPARVSSNPDWFTLYRRTIESRNSEGALERRESPKITPCKMRCTCQTGNTSEEFINIPTDEAADCEMKKRLKLYRRGLSEIETGQSVFTERRRHSVSGTIPVIHTSSSESVDEADVVLNRLKRRILRNKLREKRRSIGAKYQFNESRDNNTCAMSAARVNILPPQRRRPPCHDAIPFEPCGTK